MAGAGLVVVSQPHPTPAAAIRKPLSASKPTGFCRAKPIQAAKQGPRRRQDPNGISAAGRAQRVMPDWILTPPPCPGYPTQGVNLHKSTQIPRKNRNYTLTLPSLSATIFEDPLFTNPENVPRIARLPGGGVRLTFKGVLGRTYAIQRSTTLLDGSWTQISTVMADHDPEIIFDDPEAPANSAFYRVGIPAQ